MKILDTDLIVSFFNNDKKAIEKLRELKESKEGFGTTVFNEQEIYYAILKEKNEEKSKVTKEFFDLIKVLNYERVCIVNTIKIQLELERRGIPIGTLDELIASICRTYNATLVTRNIKHFSRIPELKIEKW